MVTDRQVRMLMKLINEEEVGCRGSQGGNGRKDGKKMAG